jgi:5-methylcytosine-specific restriction protein B
VQFHPSYAYEDFVEGIRPKVTSDEKELRYEVRPGIFRQLISRATEFAEERFFLIIDEMNRANLPRVLGELLFALEYRGDLGEVELPYSAEKLSVPKNITIIGTMNSADRSIALVDAAVRRRFRHVEFSPDAEVARSWLKAHDQASVADEAAERLLRLDAALTAILDADRLIGHTYLMRDDLAEAGFESVWNEDIEPVLREHLYNQPEDLARMRETFLG